MLYHPTLINAHRDAERAGLNRFRDDKIAEGKLTIGDWFQTIRGHKLWVLDPNPFDVDILEIGHALSLVNRFGGHARWPYSVAQHSVLVSRWIAEQGANALVQFLGLMHDTPEAYLGDVIRPLKRSSPAFFEKFYRPLERRWEVVIGAAIGFDFPDPLPSLVKLADDALLATERRDLLNEGPAWGYVKNNAATWHIEPWPWDYARDQFLKQFIDLKALIS